MQNFKLTLQYDGTRYLGWTRPEKDGYEKTVSYRIASVLERMTGEHITLFAGAKTEPGVHAMEQIVNFQTESPLSSEEFRTTLNRYLPRDIAVLNCEQVPERFRADLNAVSRTYEYRICTAKIYDVFTAAYRTHIYPAPDKDLMQEAALLLLGRHDFRGFSGGRKKKKTEKELLDVHIISDKNEDNFLILSLTADDFLYQMPALITGALLEIGLGKRPPESVSDILSGREKAGVLCNPKGLLLRSVQYNCNSSAIY